MKASGLQLNSIFYSINHPFTIGDGSIKGTMEFQIITFPGGESEVECVDYKDVSFLGNLIEDSYEAFKKFKATMLDLGVDVAKLLDEEVDKFETQFKNNKQIQLKLKKQFELVK